MQKKQMVDSSFGRRFHDPNYFEVDFLLLFFLSSSSTWGHPNKILYETINLLYFCPILNKF